MKLAVPWRKEDSRARPLDGRRTTQMWGITITYDDALAVLGEHAAHCRLAGEQVGWRWPRFPKARASSR